MPLDTFEPTTETELARFVAENANGPRRSLYPVGGRTALGGVPGPAADGVALSLSPLDGVVDYPARDMTITVGAGIRMDKLAELLLSERQRLPVDVPQSQRATLGGVIATNTSGPSRFGHGTMRDHVIGIAACDGRGRLFHAGGRVVKNVAGYDLCKMLVGSVGTLAVITTVTLKLSPIPESQRVAWSSFPDLGGVESALERLVTSATRPVLLNVLDAVAAKTVARASGLDLPHAGPVLVAGFEGTAPETEWQSTTLHEELSAATTSETLDEKASSKLRGALADFRTRSDGPLVFKASTRPSATIGLVERAVAHGCAVQSHAGNGIVYGHLPDDVTDPTAAAAVLSELRTLVGAEGSLVVDDCDPGWHDAVSAWGEPRPEWLLMGRLRETFDPLGVLNPGRCPDWLAAANVPSVERTV